jgi:hypothetical protein
VTRLEGVELGWVESLCAFHGWPDEVGEAAFEVFGPRVFNSQGRSFRLLNRRVRHALSVWEQKYGHFSDSQESYAGSVLAWAIRRGAREAGGDRANLYPYVLHSLAGIVNHEKVDAGFKRRREEDFYQSLEDVLRRVPA